MSEDQLDVYLLNEELVEKLKLINYEANFSRVKGHKPLTKTYFCQKNGHGGEQNVYFFALATWLVNQCGGKISSDQKYDDPVTLASNLLTEMKNVGIECGVPPNQLRQGFGTPICIVLISLVNKVIQKIGFSFKQPKLDEKRGNSKEDGYKMRKYLPILLIATIACTIVEETQEEVVLQKSIIKRFGNEIKKGVKNAGNEVKKGVKNAGNEVKKGVKNVENEVKKGVKNVENEVEKGVKHVGKEIKEKVKNLKKKIEPFLRDATKVIKSSVKYLKEHGILDKVLKALIEVGKIAAVTACTTYGGPVVGEICNVAIGFIADQVINK